MKTEVNYLETVRFCTSINAIIRNLSSKSMLDHPSGIWEVFRSYRQPAEIISHLQRSYPTCRDHIPLAEIISHLQRSYPTCRDHIPLAEIISHLQRLNFNLTGMVPARTVYILMVNFRSAVKSVNYKNPGLGITLPLY